MYFIAIRLDNGEYRIVKHVSTKEDAAYIVRKVREHKLKADVLIFDNGKYKRLINI